MGSKKQEYSFDNICQEGEEAEVKEWKKNTKGGGERGPGRIACAWEGNRAWQGCVCMGGKQGLAGLCVHGRETGPGRIVCAWGGQGDRIEPQMSREGGGMGKMGWSVGCLRRERGTVNEWGGMDGSL